VLTSKGFGFGQAPRSGDKMAKYIVIRGVVIDGARQPGDIVELNPKSQQTVELMAYGKIRLVADEEIMDVEITNRAIGVDTSIQAPIKRGRKNGRN